MPEENETSKAIGKGLALLRSKPLVGLLALVLIVLGIFFWKRESSGSIPCVEVSGSKNQTACTNDGSMQQTNR